MDKQAFTYATEKDRRADLRRRKIAHIKQGSFMLWHKFYWSALHLFRLSRPYSVLMCKVNLYRKYLDGRCQWCGTNHDILG